MRVLLLAVEDVLDVLSGTSLGLGEPVPCGRDLTLMADVEFPSGRQDSGSPQSGAPDGQNGRPESGNPGGLGVDNGRAESGTSGGTVGGNGDTETSQTGGDTQRQNGRPQAPGSANSNQGTASGGFQLPTGQSTGDSDSGMADMLGVLAQALANAESTGNGQLPAESVLNSQSESGGQPFGDPSAWNSLLGELLGGSAISGTGTGENGRPFDPNYLAVGTSPGSHTNIDVTGLPRNRGQ